MGTDQRQAARSPMPSLVRVAMVGYAVGGPLAAAGSFVPMVYRPDAWKVLVPVSLGLCVWSLCIAVRRTEPPVRKMLALAYCIVLCGLQAHYTATDAGAIIMITMMGGIVAASALGVPERTVIGLMVLAAVEIILLNPLSSTGLVSRAIIGGTMIAASLVASVSALAFRRQLEQALEQIKEIARTDPLTGLVNRRGLAEQMPFMLAMAARERRSVAVLTADLDHFKRINDEYGHAEGDAVLREVSAAITGAVRQHDVVARLGGEELCVVAILEHPGTAGQVGERVRKVVERDVTVRPVTVSIGVVELAPATLAASQEDPAELLWRVLDQADVLLYEVKEAGRNAVRVVSM